MENEDFYVETYGLFNDTVIGSHYIASNVKDDQEYQVKNNLR